MSGKTNIKRRKISRQLLQLLPDGPRLKLVRRLANIDPKWPSESLEIKIADNEAELASAYRLLHDSYVGSGFMNPNATGMRVLPQHLLPQTTTIVAKWDGQVVGTLSLIRDNPIGLPMEKIFDLEERRGAGRRLAEVSSLAIDPRYRGHANQALFPLFRFVYQYAKHYFGTHEFVIAVNPSTVDMYLGFMCFERLQAKSKAYDFVKGAPAVGLYLNFQTSIERWKKEFSHRDISKNFHNYWTVIPTHINNRLPVRSYHSSSDPIITPQLLKEFFLEKAQLAKSLNYNDLHILINAYPFPAFQKILKPLHDQFLRKTPRMETHMRAQLEEVSQPCEVWNVSASGFLLRAEADHLKVDQNSKIEIWLNETQSTRLEVKIQWTEKNLLYGALILNPTREWKEMIEALEAIHAMKPIHLKVAK